MSKVSFHEIIKPSAVSSTRNTDRIETKQSLIESMEYSVEEITQTFADHTLTNHRSYLQKWLRSEKANAIITISIRYTQWHRTFTIRRGNASFAAILGVFR